MHWLRETRDVFHSYDNLDLVAYGKGHTRTRKVRSDLWLALLGSLGLGMLLWAFALPASPAVTDLHRDISYHPQVRTGSSVQRLDIYSRKPGWSLWGSSRNARPVVVFVHDGSQENGDKAHAYFRARQFLNQGYVFVPINYQTGTQISQAAKVADISRAVAWVSRHIHKYRGDGAKISLVGEGVGRELIALLKKASQ